MTSDGLGRYDSDPLAGDWRAASQRAVPEVSAERDLVVELPSADSSDLTDDFSAAGFRADFRPERTPERTAERNAADNAGLSAAGTADNAGGFVGAVVRVDAGNVHLEDRRGLVRVFPLGAGFLVDGEPVVLVAPPAPLRASTLTPGRARTASGSFAVPDARARVARASRIWVEGRHDAELVEQVWGDDLRVEGVVVEQLEGADHLAQRLAEFSPGPGRRVGVLLDHWVEGSKESRLAADALAQVDARHVLVVGHPFIDIWQAVRPAAVGIVAWPEVPRSEDWKTGICRALGWPHASIADRAAAWRRIRGAVHGFADLEPVLLGRVEQLIDFVTADA